jgi:transketolase
LRNSIAYPNANVKIGATHCGITTGGDGASHQANEDIAICRVLPNMTILVPGDYEEARQATRLAAFYQGPVYLRFGRDAYPDVSAIHRSLELGKAKLLSSGQDITLISTGIMVSEVLIAAEILQTKGISCRVIHMPCIKPLDQDVVIQAARETRGIVTAEEHSIIGGLGEAVASTVCQYQPTRVERIGMLDVFGESGQAGELMDKFGLRAKNIIEAVFRILENK